MEIEIKLSPVTQAQFSALLSDPAVAPHLSLEPEITHMEAIYYDDIPGNLAQRKMTLRLRRENGVGICTFKAPAQGEFARLEVECPAETVEQGVQTLLEQGKLPFPAAALLSRMMLVPTCGARFVRRENRVTMEDVVFLLSWDQGELYAGDNTAPLSEIELEFCSGSVEALVREARRLMEVYGLPFCKDSKQKRAAALEDK